MTKVIVNLTQHAASPEQQGAGVVDCSAADQARVRELLTFNGIPAVGEMRQRAERLAELALKTAYGEAEDISPLAGRAAREGLAAMIGGAPWFMATLERILDEYGITPVYAFSERIVEEVVQADGSVKKTAVFKHSGFIYAELL